MHDAAAELARIVGADGIVADGARLAAMLTDERQLFTGRALAVVQPATVAELAGVVEYCAARRIEMVPQGGNTGYCGGATPDGSGSQVLISLSRLNRLRAADPIGHTITVDAGMVLKDVQDHAADLGLLFPLSMGSEGSCQIGGNLSTNAGGLAVLRYGTARDLVLGLEVVLPNGEVLEDLHGLRKNNTGYDLKQLFLGAEGTLGIISGVQLKLFARPSAFVTAWAGIPDMAAGHRLLRGVQSELGECVTSFEYISRRSLEYVLAQVDGTVAPLEPLPEHMALIELSAFGDGEYLRDGFIELLGAAAKEGRVHDVVVAHNDTQRRQLWRLRELIPSAEKNLGGSIKHDVSVALPDVAALVEAATEAVRGLAPSARLSVYGHVGDGNVHFNVLAPEGENAAAFKRRYAAQISAAVHRSALDLNGSFSAEHGVGQLKTAELAAAKSAAALGLMRTVKTALDPHGLMNPGKVVT